jgi:DNA-binding transcriptional ArsR family regulator
MRLWLSKHSEVPLREQLARQIMFGVLSDDLKPGERLPSTRELARRFRIHPNTVSAAYRDLERAGWVEVRRGSGVYVRRLGGDGAAVDLVAEAGGAAADGAAAGSRLELDRLISAFFTLARLRGFSLADVRGRLTQRLARPSPDHFLVVEPDERLREILLAEVAEATGFAVRGVGYEGCGGEAALAGAAVVALYSKAEEVRRALPAGASVLFLRARSVTEALAGERPPARDALVSVVSSWPGFLEWARVFLVAAGVDAGSLDLRDARRVGWERGLRSSAYVISDALTARRLPPDVTARVYRVVADSSLAELRGFVERFLAGETERRGD